MSELIKKKTYILSEWFVSGTQIDFRGLPRFSQTLGRGTHELPIAKTEISNIETHTHTHTHTHILTHSLTHSLTHLSIHHHHYHHHCKYHHHHYYHHHHCCCIVLYIFIPESVEKYMIFKYQLSILLLHTTKLYKIYCCHHCRICCCHHHHGTGIK